MSPNQLLLEREGASSGLHDQLLVTWQDPETRRYHAIGVLSRNVAGSFQFRYLKGARSLSGFRPLLGFSDIDHQYESATLFPIFAERILDQSRPDRTTLYDALDLVATAGPMEFLARSGGRRAGDRIELLPTPSIDGTRTECTFLVHGVRHIEGASEAVDRLHPGQRLDLQAEPDNPSDPDAVLVTTDGTRLGWVPNPLLEYVRAVMATGDVRVTVVRANPRQFGHHMRLLVSLEGAAPRDYVAWWNTSAD